MNHSNAFSVGLQSLACAMLLAVIAATSGRAEEPQQPPAVDEISVATTFAEQVRPLLQKYCLRCHNAETTKSGLRLDRLDDQLADRQLFVWQHVLKQLELEAMPPAKEPQPTVDELRVLTQWIPAAISLARSRDRQKNGSVRRLTVSQYRNTLHNLLGLAEDLTDILPPDGISKDGFANNGQTLLLSPLQVESYFDIAEQALERCVVDETARPAIQNFRLELGSGINPAPTSDKLILGANSLLLNSRDFRVTEMTPEKPFDFTPFRMRTAYEFIEGYQGNATVRGLRSYDSLDHSVFACLRGTTGYPRGEPYQTVPEGLLLRPAIPSSELFGVSSTYGPMANFKISLRELPEQGNFRVTVTAARYDDALLLESGVLPHAATGTEKVIAELAETSTADVVIEHAGIYLADVCFVPAAKASWLDLQLGCRHFRGQLFPEKPAAAAAEGQAENSECRAPFMLVQLPVGPLTVSADVGDNGQLRQISFSQVPAASPLGERFRTFQRRAPRVGVHVGLRRDCGSTLNPVGPPQTVAATDFQSFVFEGAINNFPSPDVEKDNVNYLAGVREIGVRSEYTDGREMPRLLIRSVEFEGPYYADWPPQTHRNIFIDFDDKQDQLAYARTVIVDFATRAFRRPLSESEATSLLQVWQTSFADTGDFQQSIKDALLVVLTSPQFLFLIENSSSPEPEPLDPYELASKLSYFLWNTAPDQTLLQRAADNSLHQALDREVERMIHDPRRRQFVAEFGSQWLSLEKFDVVEVDRGRYPRLTRDTKVQLRQEPIEFLGYLLEHNLPLRNLLQSEFILANEVVASYYDLGDRTQSGFEFIPIRHQDAHLGGLLTQASILAGLSDGRESNPVKRGAWLARKMIAEPPDDPPPNVPQLTDENTDHLTLRERLERHRDQEGCAKCHAGIDPWGIPFETFDAGGRFKQGLDVDAHSILPDTTEITDLNGLKAYLAHERLDQVAFSFLKHLTSYALGRSLTYNEIVFLREKSLELEPTAYRMQDLVRFVVSSEMFLQK